MKKALSPFLIIILIAVVFGCNRPEKETDEEQFNEVEETERAPITSVSGETPDYRFRFASLALKSHIDSLDLRAFRHFGEFYTEDFVIYRLERLDYLVENFFIDDINLYFIDSTLVKVQAYLREDRSNDFMRRYGRAKISINDYHNKKLLEEESVLTRVDGKMQINEKLDNYTLRWPREDRDIYYEVKEKNDTVKLTPAGGYRRLDDKNFRYKLTVQVKDFEHQMAWIRWESYKESKGLTTPED